MGKLRDEIKAKAVKEGQTIMHEQDAQIVLKRKDGSVGVITVNEEPTTTQEQFLPETDVNEIMAKYVKSPNPAIFIKNGKGRYGDFSEVTDYQTSLHKIMEAEQAFLSLDARIRDRFENDPQKLFAFLNDSKNQKEAEELGLVKKTEAPPPTGYTPPPKEEPK